MDSLQFGAALHQYEELRRKGKRRPVADPGPTPKEVQTATAIQSRYRKQSATAQVILIAIWFIFILMPVTLPEVFYYGFSIFGFVLIYPICHFAVMIPVLRRKREKAYTQAGFDKSRYLEL